MHEGRELRTGPGHLPDVVEHEDEVPFRELARKLSSRTERARNRGRQEPCVRQRREVDERCPVRRAAGDLAAHLERQARLADAARAGERDEARAVDTQRAQDVDQLLLAPHEGLGLRRRRAVRGKEKCHGAGRKLRHRDRGRGSVSPVPKPAGELAERDHAQEHEADDQHPSDHLLALGGGIRAERHVRQEREHPATTLTHAGAVGSRLALLVVRMRNASLSRRSRACPAEAHRGRVVTAAHEELHGETVGHP